ncbi:hypothetical protein [Enterococcus faecalis]|uniref:hypothetical protein n=1 Tax=Enterococcus faecalis TaxID=1351 RepID=UPI00164FD221|nr:hypothetical protein [Enterococcus faecalis]
MNNDGKRRIQRISQRIFIINKNSSDKDKKITIEYFRKKATEAPSRATRNFCLRMVNFAVQSLKEKEVRISNFTSMDDL